MNAERKIITVDVCGKQSHTGCALLSPSASCAGFVTVHRLSRHRASPRKSAVQPESSCLIRSDHGAVTAAFVTPKDINFACHGSRVRGTLLRLKTEKAAAQIT
eukprot:754731-Hanusia_phi.AAC.8